ncbi:ATP-grasp domain-containing protein [Bacillus cereus]
MNEKLEGFSFPVIVKPSNDSGSKNVYLCKDYNEVKQAVDVISNSKLNLVGQTLDPEAIVEEYLDGPEYSIESYTIDGKTTIVGVTEKVVTPFPLSVEVGHNFPKQFLRKI